MHLNPIFATLGGFMNKNQRRLALKTMKRFGRMAIVWFFGMFFAGKRTFDFPVLYS